MSIGCSKGVVTVGMAPHSYTEKIPRKIRNRFYRVFPQKKFHPVRKPKLSLSNRECNLIPSYPVIIPMRTHDQFGTVIINGMPRVVTPVCDNHRHLVCEPYSVEILHEVAKWLGIKRHWFHKTHYDIPKRRIDEITKKCRVVSAREVLKIIKSPNNILTVDLKTQI